MNFIKKSVALALGLFLVAGSVFAQGQQMPQTTQPDSITDQELKKFVSVTNEVQKVQMESQKKVQSMLSEKDMDMQRFRQIMMSKRNPKMADSVDVTPEEEQTIKELQPKLMKVQQDSRKEMMSSMQENNLKPQRFQAIMKAVRSNPDVMKRVQKISQDSAQN